MKDLETSGQLLKLLEEGVSSFHTIQASVKRLRELRSSGYTYAFSALFQPVSVKKDVKGGGHRRFVYEEEILELLEAIDGSREEEGLLGFLDYPKIKEGSMCRHMVCVLPYCASCDALEALIERERGRFKNLGGYKLVNISGVERPGRERADPGMRGARREDPDPDGEPDADREHGGAVGYDDLF